MFEYTGRYHNSVRRHSALGRVGHGTFEEQNVDYLGAQMSRGELITFEEALRLAAPNTVIRPPGYG